MEDIYLPAFALPAFFIILFLIQVIVYFTKRKKFERSYHLYYEKIRKEKYRKGKRINLMYETIGVVLGICLILFLDILFVRIIDQIQEIFKWVFSILAVFPVFLWGVKDYKKALWIIIGFFVFFEFLVINNLLNSNYYHAISIGALITGVSIWVFTAHYLRKLRSKYQKLQLKGFTEKFLKLIGEIRKSKLIQNDNINDQIMVISVITVVFIVFPKVSYLFPEESQDYISKLASFFTDNQKYIPYFAYLGYLILSFNTLNDYVGGHIPVGQSLRSRISGFGYKGLIILLSVPYIIISGLVFAIIVFTGQALVGEDFAIFLSFFVFPQTMPTIMAWIIAILLLAYPNMIEEEEII
ncbi:MAG: hypothetical protein K9G67_06310 [Bacteroidales bacterium]|nr:hypothetical protein [Bacteroidales bacterium]MCF8349829.1 hypothetical protein [Bacteroidales bacterium]MCF8375950.1 hypothetical protein [Bacteroidales bacterium]